MKMDMEFTKLKVSNSIDDKVILNVKIVKLMPRNPSLHTKRYHAEILFIDL